MKHFKSALLALVMVVTASSFAGEIVVAGVPGSPVFRGRPGLGGPVIEPGPVQAIDQNGAELIEVLTNVQNDFAKFAEQRPVGVRGTFQAVSPEISRFAITGMLIEGDIVRGSVTMNIIRTRHKNETEFPQPFYFTYEANVITNNL